MDIRSRADSRKPGESAIRRLSASIVRGAHPQPAPSVSQPAPSVRRALLTSCSGEAVERGDEHAGHGHGCREHEAESGTPRAQRARWPRWKSTGTGWQPGNRLSLWPPPAGHTTSTIKVSALGQPVAISARPCGAASSTRTTSGATRTISHLCSSCAASSSRMRYSPAMTRYRSIWTP